MKKDIHPEYVPCHVTCACGNEFDIYTNRESMRIELCDKCHPFYTGNEKQISAGGRVDKFKKKYGLK
jgi:large subunit ribosomal protein L31